jgi:hypothetical protein
MKAVLIPTALSKELEVVEVKNNFRSIAAVIGGGCRYIEVVPCRNFISLGWVLIVDEEGIANGQALNHRATRLHGNTILGAGVVLEGDADKVAIKHRTGLMSLQDPALVLGSLKSFFTQKSL